MVERTCKRQGPIHPFMPLLLCRWCAPSRRTCRGRVMAPSRPTSPSSWPTCWPTTCAGRSCCWGPPPPLAPLLLLLLLLLVSPPVLLLPPGRQGRGRGRGRGRGQGQGPPWAIRKVAMQHWLQIRAAASVQPLLLRGGGRPHRCINLLLPVRWPASVTIMGVESPRRDLSAGTMGRPPLWLVRAVVAEGRRRRQTLQSTRSTALDSPMGGLVGIQLLQSGYY